MTESDTGGVKPISIEGRIARERERLLGMTDDERAWRAKFLKSQHIAHGEPVMTPEMYKQYYNPIRRFYRAPLNVFEKAITPLVGKDCAFIMRRVIGKFTMGTIALYVIYYHLKYNHATWERLSGWTIIKTRPANLPSDPGYPKNVGIKNPNQYASKNFENSPI
nr:uncharacterized protein LOC117228415 [Megalopta genalis]